MAALHVHPVGPVWSWCLEWNSRSAIIFLLVCFWYSLYAKEQEMTWKNNAKYVCGGTGFNSLQITTRGLIVCVLWFVGEEVTRFPVILSSWESESGWCFPCDRFFSLMTDTINRSEIVIKCAQITTIVNCRFVESPNSQRFQAYYVCNYFTMSQYICCIKTE